MCKGPHGPSIITLSNNQSQSAGSAAKATCCSTSSSVQSHSVEKLFCFDVLCISPAPENKMSSTNWISKVAYRIPTHTMFLQKTCSNTSKHVYATSGTQLYCPSPSQTIASMALSTQGCEVSLFKHREVAKDSYQICEIIGQPDTIHEPECIFNTVTKNTNAEDTLKAILCFALQTLHFAFYAPHFTLDNPQFETTQSNTCCNSKTLTLYTLNFICNMAHLYTSHTATHTHTHSTLSILHSTLKRLHSLSATKCHTYHAK